MNCFIRRIAAAEEEEEAEAARKVAESRSEMGTDMIGNGEGCHEIKQMINGHIFSDENVYILGMSTHSKDILADQNHIGFGTNIESQNLICKVRCEVILQT